MGEPTERLKEQIRILRSGNRMAILDTVKQLRRDGHTSVLPDLLEILITREDEEINREIASLLNDLKDPEAVPLLIKAIEDPAYREVLPLLVSACWQNGLSFGGHLDAFIPVLVNEKYEAAIEAFTVIEEHMQELDPAEQKRLAAILVSHQAEAEEVKAPLLSELVKLFRLSESSNNT